MTRKQGEHIDHATLLDIAEGRGSGTQRRTHLDRCSTCSRAVEEMSSIVNQMRTDRGSEPPESTIQSAISLFAAREPVSSRIIETLARLVRGGPELRLAATAGVRGESTSPARAFFHGDGLDVDLEIESMDRGVRLTGQVLPAAGDESPEGPILAWVEQDGKTFGAAPIDDNGLFVLERLPHGALDVVLDIGERRLRLKLPGGEA